MKHILTLIPSGKNLSLYQIKHSHIWIPLTDTKVRRHFAHIIQEISLQDSGIPIHTLTCSGAAFAFNLNVHSRQTPPNQ